ncbi:hypothetical protein N7501_006925 [Penicillium viridicatum]|nr:hypothetical protein N7501_006925 [Penicillium viridicatum]
MAVAAKPAGLPGMALYGVSARPLRELVFVLANAAAGNRLTVEDQTCRAEYFGVLPTHHAAELPLKPPKEGTAS